MREPVQVQTPATYEGVLTAAAHLIAAVLVGTLYSHARPAMRHAWTCTAIVEN
ncbi:MAG: hypothetical protein OXE94_13815 [Aestuariivita sp.]|nr:hypothetical protein [Aestuariivita sp.]MCY4203018.1 hypothetical protein [Aestuariivita sp.]